MTFPLRYDRAIMIYRELGQASQAHKMHNKIKKKM